ncbi:MAG TPA: MATE family efflux transporter [Azospirillaceae bacterium]|nr:MATE family efflux transporter [Azospirillaceae bacterium]
MAATALPRGTAAGARAGVRRELARLALPASLEMVLQSVLFLVDMVVLARLAEAAVGAVGFVNATVGFLMLALSAVGTGGAALVAHALGAGDAERARRLSGHILATGAVLGVLAALALGAGAEALAAALEPEAAAMAAAYLGVVAWGVPALLLQTLAGACLRAAGDTRTPFLVATAALAGKTALTWALAFGAGPLPALGVEGAALATLAAQAGAGAALLALLFRPASPLALAPRHLARIEAPLLRELAVLALPVAVGQGLWALGSFGYSLMYARLGTSALVASQIVAAVEGMAVRAAFGLAVAAVALVGRALGAGDVAAAREAGAASLALGFRLALVGAAGVAAAAGCLAWLYPSVPAATRALAALGLLAAAASLPVRVANMVFGNGIMRGGGDAAHVMRVDCLTVFGVGVPVAAGLGLLAGGGFLGVMAGRIVEELARFWLLTRRWRGGGWVRLAARGEERP